MQFNELHLSPEVLQAIEDMGFTELTEIQEKTIPLLMEGIDVIGRSNTGTGKTAAFGIPAVESISKDADKKCVEVLILCPTRELAMQACEEIKKFSSHMKWVKPCAVYGGASIDRQILELKRGANIVVGTPGRVMDHIDRRTLKLQNVRTVILDEADEMLNMGFREDIESILKSVPDERQTVLFSATMPPEILAITKQYQNDPQIIKIVNKYRTVDTIEQYYFEVPAGRKNDALRFLLLAYEPKAAMIFCNTKKAVDDLAESLSLMGFKVAGLHGDMKQAQRTMVMDRFKSGRTSVLIATDVAARGIDVSGIDVVFNYDIPQDNEYYIHRIGRTGRAGKSGVAYTLVCGRKQIYDLRGISRYIKAEIVKKDLPTKKDIAERKLIKLSDRIKLAAGQDIRPEASALLERMISEGMTVEQIAASLINIRLNKELKSIPETDMPVIKSSDNRAAGGRNVRSGATNGKTVKVDISVGRAHRIAPNFILGALVDATGMPGKSFGKIDIFDKHTTVEVPEKDHEFVIDSMNQGKINGNKVTVRLYDGGSAPRSGGFSRGGNGSARKPYGKNNYGGNRRRGAGSEWKQQG